MMAIASQLGLFYDKFLATTFILDERFLAFAMREKLNPEKKVIATELDVNRSEVFYIYMYKKNFFWKTEHWWKFMCLHLTVD